MHTNFEVVFDSANFYGFLVGACCHLLINFNEYSPQSLLPSLQEYRSSSDCSRAPAPVTCLSRSSCGIFSTVSIIGTRNSCTERLENHLQCSAISAWQNYVHVLTFSPYKFSLASNILIACWVLEKNAVQTTRELSFCMYAVSSNASFHGMDSVTIKVTTCKCCC